MAKLTDRQLAQSTAITPTTLIHIVTTADISQDSAGSSYKAELSQLSTIFSELTFTGGTVSGATTFLDDVCFDSIPSGSTGYTLSVTDTGCLIIATGETRVADLEVSGDLRADLVRSNSFSAQTMSANTVFASGIRSFSPLFINDGDEGPVYFGSTSGITIDVPNSRIGIGTTSPSYALDIQGSGSLLNYDPTSAGGRVVLSGTTGIPRIDTIIPPYLTRPIAGATLSMRTWDDATYNTYGKVGDFSVRVGNDANGLNLINTPGAATEDYIRLYAGQIPTGTADIHIQGTGTTRGYVGIGTETPSEILDVNGNTNISGNLSSNTITITTSFTPSGTTDTTGSPGSIAWDDDNFYYKTNNGWFIVTGNTF